MGTSWLSVLEQRSSWSKPWLILPEAPRESDAHRAISFAELHARVRSAANVMLMLSKGQARRVVLIADNSPESAICILAALCAGLVLVPTAPPSLGPASAAWSTRLQALVDACRPALVVGPEVLLKHVRADAETTLCRLADVAATGELLSVRHCAPEADEIALWQSTSGTTSAAKVVMLSHANLLSNVAAIGARIGATEHDVGASWLPFFHDMGLIGALLFSAYWGMSLVLLKPRAFTTHPETWLWAIDRFKVTCSPAPNSAYAICAKKVPESKIRGLDLSSWRVALNGAEHVHPATLDDFCARYGAHGFKRQAMYPVYGLAEHTVAATLPQQVSGPELDWIDSNLLTRSARAEARLPGSAGTRAVVSVGSALPGHKLRVVGADRNVLSERQVGEIELSGPSRMCGYRGDSASASLSADGWLSTGDLGYLAAGKLFVVGRRKHIIKRAGAKIDAGVLASSVALVAGVRAVAVFGVAESDEGTERLVIQAEVGRLSEQEGAQLRRAIVVAVREVADFVPDCIELVSPGTIPRTTSGKVQHMAARASYAARMMGLESSVTG